MSYCLNLNCANPQNQYGDECLACGAKLLLRGRYLPISVLGQGGFGKTLKAINQFHPDGKFCVIKQFTFSSNNPNAQAQAAALFQQEAIHLQALGSHPQIPALVDFFSEAGQSFLIQEFIDGQNLEQELATEGQFSEYQAKQLLSSLLPVLAFLHNQAVPILHRDIKPANIIRRHSDGELVLVDFGAAKLASQTMLAKTGTLIGSPEYVAPEQARGKATFASDIYSLGVTCIHSLTLISPWDLQSSDGEWVWRNFLGDNKITEPLGSLIDRMIFQRQSLRYAIAADVLNDLREILTSTENPQINNSDNLLVSDENDVPVKRQRSPLTTNRGMKYLVSLGAAAGSIAVFLPLLLKLAPSITLLGVFGLFQGIVQGVLVLLSISYFFRGFNAFSDRDPDYPSIVGTSFILLLFSYFTPHGFGILKHLIGI